MDTEWHTHTYTIALLLILFWAQHNLKEVPVSGLFLCNNWSKNYLLANPNVLISRLDIMNPVNVFFFETLGLGETWESRAWTRTCTAWRAHEVSSFFCSISLWKTLDFKVVHFYVDKMPHITQDCKAKHFFVTDDFSYLQTRETWNVSSKVWPQGMNSDIFIIILFFYMLLSRLFLQSIWRMHWNTFALECFVVACFVFVFSCRL